MIEMLSDVVPDQAHHILPVLTASEFAGLQSAINLWAMGLQRQQGGEQW
jgi:hypothetical protein